MVAFRTAKHGISTHSISSPWVSDTLLLCSPCIEVSKLDHETDGDYKGYTCVLVISQDVDVPSKLVSFGHVHMENSFFCLFLFLFVVVVVVVQLPHVIVYLVLALIRGYGHQVSSSSVEATRYVTKQCLQKQSTQNIVLTGSALLCLC